MCILILGSALEADRLESAQLEFGIAEVLHDGCCKKILPDSFSNEPYLRYFTMFQMCEYVPRRVL